MRNRRNIIAVILLLLILALGGVSIFVAYRISTQEAVAPTAPTSEPAAAVSCTGSGGACIASTAACAGVVISGSDCATDEKCCPVPWTGSTTCQTTFSVPAPLCEARPACLDATPTCLVPPPAGGWCPALLCPSALKSVYKNVADNTPGVYNMDAANKLADGSTVAPGETIIYAVEYSPEGGDVVQATVDDLLSSNVDFVDSTSECAKQTGSNRVLCNISKQATATGITAGKVAIRVKVKETALPGALANVASISAQYLANDVIASTTSKSMCRANLNISIAPTVIIACKSKTAMNSTGTAIINAVGENETFMYSLEVTNTGNTNATEVIVTDSLTANKLIFVDSDSGCTYDEATKNVTCNTPLSAGETKKLTFRVKTSADLTDKEVIANTASAKLPTTIESGSECAKSVAVALPVLTAEKDAFRDNTNNVAGTYHLTDPITTISKNQTFAYSVKVTNTGTGTASGIIINDPLTGENQDQLTFVDLDPRCQWTVADKLIKCTMDLQPGANSTLAFRVKVADGAVNGSIVKNAGVVTHGDTTLNVTKDLTVSTVVACDHVCTSDAECESGYTCDTTAGKCRNSQCSSEVSCVCPAIVTATPTSAPRIVTPTAAPTVTAQVTPTLAQATATPTEGAEVLPEAGIFDLPGAAIFGGGLLLAIVGILLAL